MRKSDLHKTASLYGVVSYCIQAEPYVSKPAISETVPPKTKPDRPVAQRFFSFSIAVAYRITTKLLLFCP